MTEIPALAPRPDVLDFLMTRRSRPAKTLSADAPDREELMRLLTAAVRVPDHGKLEPWRFVVIPRGSMERVAAAARARADALGLDEAAADKAARAFTEGGAIVAVLCSPKGTDKIPLWEQEMSAACVCYGLLTAALAAGWGASWLSGPLARDAMFLESALGARPGESVSGFLHLGRETAVPPDRPRPEVEGLVAWV